MTAASRHQDALRREGSAARHAFNQHPTRRLGGAYQSKPRDERSNDQKMEDKALVQQSMAMQAAFENEQEVRKAVIAAYAGGSNALSSQEIEAVVKVAWSMKLDPSPGVGHLYAWKDRRGQFVIAIGYQGYLYKAKQEHELFVYPAREMTPEERERHQINDGDVGAIVEVIDVAKARQARELGIEVPKIVGAAVWRAKKWNSNKQRWEENHDNIPAGRTAFWVAQKNALKDALRQLGLGFGSMPVPQVEGFEYDREQDSWASVDGDVIDGQIEDCHMVNEITVRRRANGDQMLQADLDDGRRAFAFSRQVWRDAGYDVEGWVLADDQDEMVVELEVPCWIEVDYSGKGNALKVVAAEMVATA